jgi:hypothetical protein
LDWVAGLIFLLTMVVTFWFIHHFAINMIYFDQWADVNVVRHAHSGSLNLSILWAQHNENRIFFPNLVVLLLAYGTHLNVVVEDYLNGALAVAAAGLVIVAHKRRSSTIRWIYYCPVAIVLLSLAPLANALFGFNLSWYLVLVGLAVALYLLDRPVLGRLALIGAVAAAVIGSFSSIQGLFIWLAGLVLLYLRRRPKGPVVVWIASGGATAAVFFVHFDFAATGGNNSYALRHPLAAIKFFFSSLGNVVGAHSSSTASTNDLVLGIAVFIVVIVALVNGFHRGRSGGGPIGIALMCFGLEFIVFVTVGRIQLGLFSESRFSVFTLLVWVGAYLALLDPHPLPYRETVSRWLEHLDRHREIPHLPIDERWPSPLWRQAAALFALGLLLLLFVVQLGFGTGGGIIDARGWYSTETTGAAVTVNIDHASDSLVVSTLGAYPATFIRQMAQFARSDHLSLFDTPLVRQYTLRRPVPVMLAPEAGATVSGATVSGATVSGATVSGDATLDASVNGITADSNVEFVVTGRGLRDASVATGRLTTIGWLASWDTTTVVNGTYEVACVVRSGGGSRTTSLPITVMVRNQRRVAGRT